LRPSIVKTPAFAATLLIAAVLAGCQSAPMPEPPSPVFRAPASPRPAPTNNSRTGDAAEFETKTDGSAYQVEVAGYRRGLVYGMNRGPLDASVAYDRTEADLDNTVTLFIRRQPGSIKSLLPHEKALVRQMHNGTALLSEKEISVSKNGRNYPAVVASFEYTDLFAGQRQALFSQLILVQVKDRVLKVRSTAPAAQAVAAQRNTMRLLDRVNWGVGEAK
jgi:hypothetical protein